MEIPAKNLKPGMTVLSRSGAKMGVSRVTLHAHRVVVIFDGDREIDFRHHDQVPIEQKTEVTS